ncbi:MAG: sortase [Oscillospiraceae bacterium]|nr:sortase [Oscillospiraceae bacterium]
MKIAKYSCFAIGTALLLTALFLVLHNTSEDRRSGKQAQELLDVLLEQIPEAPAQETLPAGGDLFAEYVQEAATEPVIEVDGRQYLGIVTIPSLGIELPVLADWSYPDLKLAPCRYRGSVDGGDLIVAAHNYRSHFGTIGSLSTEDRILFTDAAGYVHTYEVDNIEQIPGTDIERMEFGSGEDWDLTLFTCTLSGQSRVTVRARLVQ